MPSHNSDLIKELFLEAIELSSQERENLIQSIEDPEVKKEVESLVANHVDDFTISISSRPKELSKKNKEFKFPLVKLLFGNKLKFSTTLFIVGIIILLTGLFTHRKIKQELLGIYQKELISSIESNKHGLDIWLNEQTKLAEIIAKAPRIRSTVNHLVRNYGLGNDVEQSIINKDARLIELNHWFRPILKGEDIAVYSILDKTGYRIASNDTNLVGKQISQYGVSQLISVFTTKAATFSPPTKAYSDTSIERSKSLVWLDVPVEDSNGKVIATLGFGYKADKEFSNFISFQSPSQNGYSFSFNQDGDLISKLPNTLNDKIQFLDAIKNTGTTDATLPVIESFAQKDREHEQYYLTPYESFTSQKVIGAYTWLPRYNIGLVAEMPAKEAFKPLKNITITFIILFSGIFILAIYSLINTFSWFKIKQENISQQSIGAYYIDDKIGEGGMGTIYLAKHKLLNRLTAIKTLKKDTLTKSNRERFEREALLASKLNHPNTVKIYDFGVTEDEEYYFAMEYLEGITLTQLMDISGPVSEQRTIHILLQTCYSLREAHHKNLIHRDIKPQNIMLCYFGDTYDFVKVLDFGLIKDLDHDQEEDLTNIFEIGGTPMYMSPERLTAPSQVDRRTDIYSVGAVAYYLLTGHKPFHKGVTDLDTINHVLNDPPTKMVNPNISKELIEIVHTCLQKQPEERFESIEILINRLEKLSDKSWNQEKAQKWWNDNLVQYLE